MAKGSTATAPTETEAPQGLQFEEVDELPVQSGRGRKPNQDTIQYMEGIKKAQESGKLISVVLSAEDQQKHRGYIRSAGNLLGVEVKSGFFRQTPDAETGRVIFGPKAMYEKFESEKKKAS